jgi:hypothetical protein
LLSNTILQPENTHPPFSGVVVRLWSYFSFGCCRFQSFVRCESKCSQTHTSFLALGIPSSHIANPHKYAIFIHFTSSFQSLFHSLSQQTCLIHRTIAPKPNNYASLPKGIAQTSSIYYKPTTIPTKEIQYDISIKTIVHKDSFAIRVVQIRLRLGQKFL